MLEPDSGMSLDNVVICRLIAYMCHSCCCVLPSGLAGALIQALILIHCLIASLFHGLVYLGLELWTFSDRDIVTWSTMIS